MAFVKYPPIKEFGMAFVKCPPIKEFGVAFINWSPQAKRLGQFFFKLKPKRYNCSLSKNFLTLGFILFTLFYGVKIITPFFYNRLFVDYALIYTPFKALYYFYKSPNVYFISAYQIFLDAYPYL